MGFCLPIIKLINSRVSLPGSPPGGTPSHKHFHRRPRKDSLPPEDQGPGRRQSLRKMGQLSSKNRNAQQVHVLLLGLDSAGKSTLLYKLKHAKDFTTIPTIGFNVEMVEVESGPALTVWDIGGQEKMRPTWSLHCEDADGLVYVVDSTDQRRLQDSREEFKHILKNEHIRHVPVVILANKQDVPGALSAEDVTRGLQVPKLCSSRSWYVQPCCALSGEGLAEAFHRLATFLQGRRKARDTLALFKQK
ncbi:ADP-ribosylation factor-like protein 14 [Perognathus longimembris pacificus]|uniref:ADP-ribosylation factor-like protein 14 n=1 Tax=Perognathus longimembris pacificus TaxID=214514 RepID=UPI002019FDEE|nr:ADP-ribosylation factor-like protein 14 [Perognathus longimembris pacificus]